MRFKWNLTLFSLSLSHSFTFLSLSLSLSLSHSSLCLSLSLPLSLSLSLSQHLVCVTGVEPNAILCRWDIRRHSIRGSISHQQQSCTGKVLRHVDGWFSLPGPPSDPRHCRYHYWLSTDSLLTHYWLTCHCRYLRFCWLQQPVNSRHFWSRRKPSQTTGCQVLIYTIISLKNFPSTQWRPRTNVLNLYESVTRKQRCHINSGWKLSLPVSWIF